jgi:hypothetical protein
MGVGFGGKMLAWTWNKCVGVTWQTARDMYTLGEPTVCLSNPSCTKVT